MTKEADVTKETTTQEETLSEQELEKVNGGEGRPAPPNPFHGQ